jgi:beta-galactosidase
MCSACRSNTRWLPIPPDGSLKGPAGVDYLEPGGIVRPVSLYVVPQVFIADVFAKLVDVLDSDRHVEVMVSLNAARVEPGPLQLRTELVDGEKVIAAAQQTVRLAKPGEIQVKLTLSNLGNVALWDNENPRLYTVVTTLSAGGKTLHEHRTRFGFREARFEKDGFFLNGKRIHLFGLNRHEVYPYVGFAMPPRVMRRDAEILRRDFHCNIVRCSHYPQSEAFLDAATSSA